MRTAEVVEALRRRHPIADGEWLFFEEAFLIDAYAVRCWQGEPPHYRRVAYEVKVSRADFLRELRQPGKRARALRVSHQFWFAMPADLAARCAADVPPECGLLAVAGDLSCSALRQAPLRPAGGWTDLQIVELLRARHAPWEKRRALKRAEEAERRERALERFVRALKAERDAAWEALERAEGAPEVGTLWEGRVPGGSEYLPWDGPGTGGRRRVRAREGRLRLAEVRAEHRYGFSAAVLEAVDRPAARWPKRVYLPRVGKLLAEYRRVGVEAAEAMV